MSQHHGAPGPYGQGPYQQPQQTWQQPQGAPQQMPPAGPQFVQPPVQPTAKPPVVAWVALGIAVAGIVIGTYNLFPYEGTQSPAFLLGVVALVMAIVGLVQATRRVTTKGWVATLALLASIASIALGWTVTQAADDTAKTDRANCISQSETFDDLNACTD